MAANVMPSHQARAKWRDLLDAAAQGQDSVIERAGKRVAAVIPYADYEAILEELEEKRADRRAIKAYEEYKRDPSGAMAWEEFEAELVAEGLLDADPVPDHR
jgi:prevent-host-death family protein